jgi:hypothetical protein
MIFEAKDITPADYLPGEDGVLRIDPQLQYLLHCRFVVSLSKEAEEAGWTMRFIHAKDGHNDFPGVSVYPPGQEGKSVLTAYRIEGGILEELSEEEAKKPYVGRFFTVVRLKQRAVAGPLDFHLPAILLEKEVSNAYLGGQKGGYDPAEWAKFMMKMCIITHDRLVALAEIDRKYADVSSH